MGAQEPAFLLRSTVNLEQTGSPRHEHLSTGLYTLMDVICSGCHSPMGWQYLQASHEVSSRHIPKSCIQHSTVTILTPDVNDFVCCCQSLMLGMVSMTSMQS